MNKKIMDDTDFENISFHDNFIHALTYDPEDSELLFDIDYLIEWLEPDEEGCYSFNIAPSTLIFYGVSNLEIDIGINGIATFDILEIKREIEPPRKGVKVPIYRYEIVLDHVGKITFSSIGFELFIRSFFPDTESQVLSRKERGGISFEKVSCNT